MVCPIHVASDAARVASSSAATTVDAAADRLEISTTPPSTTTGTDDLGSGVDNGDGVDSSQGGASNSEGSETERESQEANADAAGANATTTAAADTTTTTAADDDDTATTIAAAATTAGATDTAADTSTAADTTTSDVTMTTGEPDLEKTTNTTTDDLGLSANNGAGAGAGAGEEGRCGQAWMQENCSDSCNWEGNTCYEIGARVQCWDLTDEAACTDGEGCQWSAEHSGYCTLFQTTSSSTQESGTTTAEPEGGTTIAAASDDVTTTSSTQDPGTTTAEPADGTTTAPTEDVGLGTNNGAGAGAGEEGRCGQAWMQENCSDSCNWEGYTCYEIGVRVQCWDLTDEAACTDSEGCQWSAEHSGYCTLFQTTSSSTQESGTTTAEPEGGTTTSSTQDPGTTTAEPADGTTAAATSDDGTTSTGEPAGDCDNLVDVFQAALCNELVGLSMCNLPENKDTLDVGRNCAFSCAGCNSPDIGALGNTDQNAVASRRIGQPSKRPCISMGVR